MGSDDATLALCGPCRHFEQAVFGPHRCALGLPLLDGAERSACARFHPFALGEGFEHATSDCCAHGHAHAEPAAEPRGEDEARAEPAAGGGGSAGGTGAEPGAAGNRPR